MGTGTPASGSTLTRSETGRADERTDPASFTGSELGTAAKCSYFYDELSNFRDIGPGQAMACDADGQTWLKPDGTKPDYPKAGRARRARPTTKAART